MGNAQARKRIKARDFDYLAKFTGFASEEVKYTAVANESGSKI